MTKSFGDDGLGQDDARRGPVAGDVVRLLGDFLHDLGAHILELVFERYLLGDRHAVIGDGRGAIALFEDDVAPARADGDLDRVRDRVDAALQRPTGFFVVQNNLRHKILKS